MNVIYSILADRPYRTRNETVNIGIVSLREDGVRVHLGDVMRKVRAVNPRAKSEAIQSWAERLPSLLGGARSVEDMTKRLSVFGNDWTLEGSGSFEFDGEEDYLRRIRRALDEYVQPAAKRNEARQPLSRLHIDLRRSFELNQWLGRDIKKHEIVSRYPIAADVTAEFAVLNGKMNFIESIDLRSENFSAKKLEIQSKAMRLDFGRKIEHGKAGCIAVIAGETSKLVEGTREILGAYDVSTYAWESTNDMRELFAFLGRATKKPVLPMPMPN